MAMAIAATPDRKHATVMPPDRPSKLVALIAAPPVENRIRRDDLEARDVHTVNDVKLARIWTFP